MSSSPRNRHAKNDSGQNGSHPALGAGDGQQPTTNGRPPLRGPPVETILWIGKIASSVEEPVIKSLLEACGAVKEWKPVRDLDTGRLKGFGFVTYAEPLGVATALHLLNGLEIDGQALALKCKSDTQKYIDWWKENRKELEQQQEEETGELSPFDAAEQAAGEKIATIVIARQPIATDREAKAAADQFLSSILDVEPSESSLPPPQLAAAAAAAVAPTRRPSVDRFDNNSARAPSRDNKRSRSRTRSKSREGNRRGHHQSGHYSSRSGGAAVAGESDRVYRERLRAWEEREHTRRRAKEREADRQADLAKERARHIQADNEYPDSDEDVDPWNRKPYFESRRAAEHLRRREKERLEDEKDAEEEMREQAVHAAVQKEQQAKVMAAADKANNAFYQAMAAAITPSKKGAAGKGGVVMASSQQTQSGVSGSAHKKPAPTRASAFAVEDEEDEDDKKQRRLIPLKYNEQELKMDASAEEERRREDAVDPQVIRKKLVSLLPKTLAELIQYPIKWEAFEYASSETHDRISAWIDKKITEFMGGEEPSFCAFIVEQVRSKTSPEDMLKSLQSVLDEDTEDFVRKLYQVLIYETEKIIIKKIVDL